MVCRIDGHLAITSGTGLRLWETEAPPTETRKTLYWFRGIATRWCMLKGVEMRFEDLGFCLLKFREPEE